MLAVAVTKFPKGAAWAYELKFHGYRAIGTKASGQSSIALAQRQGFHPAMSIDRARNRRSP